jgi:hypothetical protein
MRARLTHNSGCFLRCYAAGRASVCASTLVMVLWMSFGLVSLTLYFAHSMSLEFRAADARVAGVVSEQAIEGAARYVGFILKTQPTNGTLPDPMTYECEAVRLGDAHFWIIGRESSGTNSSASMGSMGSAGLTPISFGLVDEASKINLNTAPTNMILWIPYMNSDLATAILDWRDTNGGSGTYMTYYAMQDPPYQNKSGPFETVDELRMLYGADNDTLLGNDINRNGILDPNENGSGGGIVQPGVLEYVTVYSREPVTYNNGYSNNAPCVSIATVDGSGDLATLLNDTLGSSRAQAIFQALGVGGGGGGGGGRQGGGGGGGSTSVTIHSPLEFYRKGQMSLDEFPLIADALTVSTGACVEGRVNINTASAQVLACLPGLCDYPDLVQNVLDYRVSNPTQLNSLAWIAEALGSDNSSVLDAMQTNDCITVHSYQYSADIAAVGPFGRGFRRVRFIFDTIDGTPKIVYRRDMTHLGWALGKEVRDALLTAKDNQ